MKIIKLHLGLLKYLIKELPKKRTPKEFVKFLEITAKAYFIELLKLYKTLFLIFDPIYQAKKKEYDKYQKIKVDLKRCLKMLQYIDDKMAKAGINRQRRRQFWRDFYTNGQIRKEVFEELLKELDQVR